MPNVEQARATIGDLSETPGKAELIDGRIVQRMPTGFEPNRVASNVFVSLREYVKRVGGGVAVNDNLAFVVPELSSGRESFSPDAGFYAGPLPVNRMRFIGGAPTFAVEVRSESDYGPAAEAEIAAKRADYFEAGTKTVWDVDVLGKLVHVYRFDRPAAQTTYRGGDVADAEPAVPGWTMAVVEVFA